MAVCRTVLRITSAYHYCSEVQCLIGMVKYTSRHWLNVLMKLQFDFENTDFVLLQVSEISFAVL